jgi:hypothetical protein
MSKKKRKAGRAKSVAVMPSPKRVRWAKAAVVAPLLLCIVAAGAASLRWQPVRRAVGLAPLSEPLAQATPTPTPLVLAKEYVYAGGRLVATEELTSLNSLCPGGVGTYPKCLVDRKHPTYVPTGMSATAVSGTAVSVVWSPPPEGGNVDHYQVERRLTMDDPNPYLFNCASSPCQDTTATPWTAYLYRVSAVFTSGVVSDYTAVDIATTAVYTNDDPLIKANDPQGRPASRVRAADLTELRRAVDLVRGVAEMGGASWKSDPAPASGGQILAAHFLELRTNLNPALQTLGLSPMPDDATLGQGKPVLASHIQDVREKVR